MEGVSMRPILYPPGTTDFTNLGIGKLRDTISAEVYEARNGAFTLEIEYPVNGVYFDQLKEFSYIKAKPNDRDDYHTFLVYEVAKSTTTRSVIVKATTKTDEIGNTLVTMTNTGNPQSLLNAMKTKALDPISYNMYSDISTSKKVEWLRRNPLNALVGEEGSLVHLFGGELKRTDSTIFLYQRRGNDKVAKFTARRGLKGAKIVVSTASIVTRILPYITILGGAEEEDVTLTGTIVNSPLVNNYPVRPLVPVDFGMIDDSIDTLAKLNSKAATYFTSLYPEIDKPKVSVDLDLLSLQDTSEYAQFKAVEKIELCDTIDVYLPKYDVVRTVKVTELYYDSLREINTRVVAGDKAISQIDAFKREYTGQVNSIKDHLSKVENTMMVKGDGTQIWSGPDTPPPDKVNINDIWWKKTGEDTWSLLIWNGLIWEDMLSDEIFKEIDIRIDQAETDIAQNVLDIESTLVKATQAELDAGFATDLAEDAKALGVSATTNANTAMADAQEAVRLAVLNAGRVSSAEESISTIAGQVSLKANTTDVNTLTGRVATAEGLITAQAGQIALKANQSVVDTLTGRVSTTESKIVATDGKVTTLTTKTDGHTTQIGTLETSYSGLSSTVTALETGKVGNDAFSALEQNLSGFKTTVANTYADKTTVTQLATQWQTTTTLANGHTSQISSLGTQVNLRATKAEVQGSLGAVNLITNGGNIQSTAGWYGPVALSKHGFYKDNTANLLFLNTAGTTEITARGEYFNIEPNTEYTITFYGFASANVKDMDLHFLSKKHTSSNTYDNARLLVSTKLSPANLDSRSVTFTTNATDNQAYIRFDNNGSTNMANAGLYIVDITLVKGSVAPSAWFESTADSIVSQINISPESILLSSKMIQIKGDTYIDNGVIKTAHIADLAVSGAKIANASIASAKIINLDASKISTNSLSAISANLGSITAGTITGKNISIDLNTGVVGIKKGIIESVGSIWDLSLNDFELRSLFKVNGESRYIMKVNSSGLNFRDNQWKTSMKIDGDSIRSSKDQEGNLTSAGPLIHLIYGTGIRLSAWRPNLTSNTLEINETSTVFSSNKYTGNISQRYINTINDEGVFLFNSTNAAGRSTFSGKVVMVAQGGGYRLGLEISARKYKDDIRIAINTIKNAHKILEVQPKSWLDKRAVAESGDFTRSFGFIADEFDEKGLKEVVIYDENGEVNSLNYDRISMYHNVILQDHEQQLKRLDNINTTVIELIANNSSYGQRLYALETEVFRLNKRIEELEKIA